MSIRYEFTRSVWAGGAEVGRDTALFAEVGPRAYVAQMVEAMGCHCTGCLNDVQSHCIALSRWWEV